MVTITEICCFTGDNCKNSLDILVRTFARVIDWANHSSLRDYRKLYTEILMTPSAGSSAVQK